jgi:formylglycine-generating enzyme required for sulfatase activity
MGHIFDWYPGGNPMQFGTRCIFLGLGILICSLITGGGIGSSETPGESVIVMLPGEVEMEFCRIPAGSFQMGSPENEEGRERGEGPQRRVTISNPFLMGKFEITHAQWKAVTGKIRNYAGFDGSNYDAPMQTTSWNECKAFVDKVNGLGIGRFRLPTEAEWEYACRAGTTTRYFWGEDSDLTGIDQYAWYDENSNGEAHDAGEKKPNPWGLYDMAGNVYEWCQDWYGPYPSEAETDPKGPATGSAKVFRGGEWFNPAENCRSAFRGSFGPSEGLYFGGLRLVMEISE